VTLQMIGFLACRAPTAGDQESLAVGLEFVDGGVAAAAIEGTAGVDAVSRTLAATLEVRVSTLPDASRPENLQLTVFDDAGRGTTVLGVQDLAVAAVTPDFATCAGPALRRREDGGCDYAFTAFIADAVPSQGLVTVALAIRAPDDWPGDPSTLDVFVDAMRIDPRTVLR